MQGQVVTAWGESLTRLRYQVLCRDGWSFDRAELRLETNGATRQLLITRDAGGWWIDGKLRADLIEARDIDIMGTPLTNTLPILRSTWEPGLARDFTMAYVRLPDLAVVPAHQRYTALAETDAERRFRYELVPSAQRNEQPEPELPYHSLSGGFSAELVVDADGLVLSYPPYWRRVGWVA